MGKFLMHLLVSDKDFLSGLKSVHVCSLLYLPYNILEVPMTLPETEMLGLSGQGGAQMPSGLSA